MTRTAARSTLLALALMAILPTPSAFAQGQAAPAGPTVRVVGTVRDQQNAISLPGVPVEVVGRETLTYTDVDGRYVLDLPPGAYELKVAMPGYKDRVLALEVEGATQPTVDVALTMTGFSEQVTVSGQSANAVSSSAEAQLSARKNAQVITDNMGALEMKANGDSDAAAAMQRVTGLSLVDNQYVFVRGLGERYSNTTLAGSVIPTTEPDKKVVPLDLFPSGLIDSVQVAKSYSPDKSAEFAGGLVQIVPLKFPSRPVFDLSYGLGFSGTATGKSIPLSPLGGRDWLGFDNGARGLPGGFPDNKIVRRGVLTPDVGYSRDEITAFGRLLENRWQPQVADGAPGQNWGLVFGQRFGKLGVVASASHSYKESFVEEERRFYRVGDGDQLEAVSDYDMQYGTQRAQLGLVGNVAYQFSSNHRISIENFYTHSGRDEGRTFEGPNTENNFIYRNYRLQYIEEGLISNGASGEHFFQSLSNGRLDWRVNVARANRDEPDLRETLYQQNLNGTGAFLLADESQSGFRMFNALNDDSSDVAANWSTFLTAGGRPTQVKFGVNYVDRSRDFQSRRFRYIPNSANTGAAINADLSQTPETLFASANVGSVFRFNEETRPVDAYDGNQTTTAVYGMGDFSLSSRLRLIAGARIERFEQEVNTFDPFGLFVSTITAENRNTDVFPGVNLVYTLTPDSNLRLGYSTTVNRPEFRELAAFEFTDVVGSRAIRGNPDLERALIQNVDARWERITGGRSVLAASVFYKAFDNPIERVVIAAANPIVTFRNADSARNFGLELEAGREIYKGLFVNANYTFVDSSITLNPEQRTVQTSLERALAGQSKNLFNLIAEYSTRGFSTRLLFNYFGDRISDVGSNEAPDVVEQGRGSIDLVFSQRIGRRVNVRVNFENLTDSEYLFTQGDADQRVFQLGRTVAFSLGYNVF
jgi:outer membrane receptor protein involved in Fe transport